MVDVDKGGGADQSHVGHAVERIQILALPPRVVGVRLVSGVLVIMLEVAVKIADHQIEISVVVDVDKGGGAARSHVGHAVERIQILALPPLQHAQLPYASLGRVQHAHSRTLSVAAIPRLTVATSRGRTLYEPTSARRTRR